jgi:hypothetical protein
LLQAEIAKTAMNAPATRIIECGMVTKPPLQPQGFNLVSCRSSCYIVPFKKPCDSTPLSNIRFCFHAAVRSDTELTQKSRGSDMLVYLSFVVCTISGAACHVTVPVERAFVGMSACQVEGMMMTPQWQEQHPGWQVKRIRCSIGNSPRDDAA